MSGPPRPAPRALRAGYDDAVSWGALLLLFVAAPAWAGPSDDAAVLAAEVQEAHCSQIVGEDVTLEAGALSTVASALETVSTAYESTRKPFLLYWRGVLAQCVGYDDNARVDLLSFWNKTGDDASVAGQRDDAVRRLRRLGVGVKGSAPKPMAGVGVGVGLLAGGGVVAGLAAWQKSVLEGAEASYRAGDLLRDDLQGTQTEGQQAADRTNAFTGVAIGLGVSSLVPFLIEALGSKKDPLAASVVPLALPGHDGGVVLSLAGRW
jgi:hypothetical protein